MKVVSVVGARPQFIKAAILSRALRQEHTEILVHTVQHYDENMSAIFFEELGIPEPEYSLQIGSGLHGAQTGAMLAAIEQVLIQEQPDWTLVYGDTNSTLAGALAAAKLHIRLAHVEAGLRSFNRRMPEEINRVLTDHAADLLFCPTQTAVDNLEAEGIRNGVHLVGDVMYESLKWGVNKARSVSTIRGKLGVNEQGYYLATVHRAENTDNPIRLQGILRALNELNQSVVFAVHPRTRKKIDEMGWKPVATVQLIEPVGYLDMVRLESAAKGILTDSGGVQKEAFWLSVPCFTLRDETEWVETVESGWNVLVGTKTNHILAALNEDRPDPRPAEVIEFSTSKCIELMKGFTT
jgi:UDP-GlcNAc3NAcA epimerase